MAATPPSGLDRRDFLKAAGFSAAAAGLSGCRRGPATEAVPFLEQPEGVVPGKALWYASSCAACPAGCGTRVKTRDGRPIKLEGNPDHPLSEGGLCAVGQASVLGLYDTERLGEPLTAGGSADWAAVDREVRSGLTEVARRGGRIRLLTGTVHSPTERSAIGRFLEGLAARGADVRHVAYDALSSSAILDAHRRTHGVRALPRYRFDRADVVVSFDADFLGTWISPVEHAAGWRKRRDPAHREPRLPEDRPALSWCVQLEGRTSLTGTKADRRVPLLPHEIAPVVAHLAARLARRAGFPWRPEGDAAALLGTAAGSTAPAPPLDPDLLDLLADRLWAARKRALVVSGSQDVAVQALVNAMNHLLGAYGETLDLGRPSLQRRGDDGALEELLAELREGTVDALLVRGANPVAELPAGPEVAEALGRLPVSVAFADHRDETARAARHVCPEPHFLEDWRDGEPVAGVVTLGQPAVRPLGGARPFVESLAAWSAAPEAGPVPSAYEQIRRHWEEAVYPRRADRSLSFRRFWDLAVHDGLAPLAVEPAPEEPPQPAFRREAVPAALAAALEPERTEVPKAGRFALALYPKPAILDGRGAENPWLQELPDPVTKVTWGNYACLSPAAARDLGVGDGDVVRLALDPAAGAEPLAGAGPGSAPGESDGGSEPPVLALPVRVQPGQHDRLVAVALGYGRVGSARFARLGPRWIHKRPTVPEGGRVGADASAWLRLDGGTLRYHRSGLAVHATGETAPLAVTQVHDRLEPPEGVAPAYLAAAGTRRPAVQEVSVAEVESAEPHGHDPHHEKLWGKREYPGPHWAMVVDLEACTGCSACVVACQAENNVPVVGRDEVLRRREMHWLRIDRYYTGEGEGLRAAHQPMLCQHCDNAPCETVCPVLATVHSSEGLNQQVYNRCVGTRYCANNCPYKVRRFNWFDYPGSGWLEGRETLVLNPDVVVRSRGVMEKCSFCVQRIQEAKGQARAEGRELADGDVTTACEQSCPARAITFGDAADPESRVARRIRSEEGRRAYRVLDELNVEPSVTYLATVRHEEEPDRG
ncbi:MAG: 4Fe-4S dicluster domain-containing protein [Thermoanaerobaculia bacterium]